MPSTTIQPATWMTRRRCCECGFDGPALQGSRGDLTLRCPRCDADLYERPPRSYAELEGFEHAPEPPRRRAAARASRLPSGARFAVWSAACLLTFAGVIAAVVAAVVASSM